MRTRSSGLGEPQPGADAGGHGVVARGPAEDEVDAPGAGPAGEQLDDLDPAGRGVAPARPAPPGCASCHGDRCRTGSPSGFGAAVDQGREQLQLLGLGVVDQEPVVEADRPLVLDDDRGRAPHGLDPVGQLGGVRHRGREADQADVLREVDDHLLPDRAPVGVLEVVDLVEHHPLEPLERARSGVDHVAQHLGGHHDDRRVAVDRVVAGEQSDLLGAVDRTRSWNFWFDSALIGVV